MKLTVKYTAGIGLVLVVGMLIYAYISAASLKRIYLQEAIRDMDAFNETLIQTTHFQMLENDRQQVYQVIERVAAQHSIDTVRLINKKGEINFSTHPGEVGMVLTKQSDICRMCHASSTPLTQATTQNRSRVFKDPRSGREVLGITRAIYNEHSCSTAACHAHPPEKHVLGLLDMIVSLDRMNAQRATVYENTLKLTLLLLVGLVIALRLMTWRFIVVPVRKLLAHTRAVAAGDLSRRVDIPPGDELGNLAQDFNEMTVRLQNTRQQLQSLTVTLESKVEQRSHQLEQMQSKLLRSEKLASLGELVAGIAHEINNPLTGILMYASMLADDANTSPQIRRDLETIVHETQRCAGILNNLLNFSREVSLQKRPESLSRLLDSSLALVEHQAAFHNIRILRQYQPELPAVEVDPGQMTQVFVNLLINAGQAMPEGGELLLKTELLPDGRGVAATLHDSGVGIPPENLQRIFDPFFTTKGAQGTGLGLSVSYGIVQNHGGQIDVESREGEGTTFTISLPLSQDTPAAGGNHH